MTEPTKDPAAVLDEAADLLLVRGVCRDGTYGEPGGPRCVRGAMHEVEGTLFCTPAVKALYRHLDGQGIVMPVSVWNDTSTDDFVLIDTLRTIAKDLRNQAVPA